MRIVLEYSNKVFLLCYITTLRTVLAVSQLLRWEADAGRSREALIGCQPPSFSQIPRCSRALKKLTPLHGHAVVWRSEVRRPGETSSYSSYSHYSVCEIPQSQTMVAWRGGRGSSVTLILGGGSDTVHWMEVKVKRKVGWSEEEEGE